MVILFSMPVIDLFLIISPLFLDLTLFYQILIALIPFFLFLCLLIWVWINNDLWVWSFIKKVSSIVFGTATIASMSFFARINTIDIPIINAISKPIIKIIVPEKYILIEFISKLKISNPEEIRIVSALFGKVDNEIIEKIISNGIKLNDEGLKILSKNKTVNVKTYKLLFNSQNKVTLDILNHAFPEKQIIEWTSQIQKSGDVEIVTKNIGQKISKLVSSNKLTKEEVTTLLESTFLRIIQKQGKIKQPNDLFIPLNGIDGFQTTLRKIMGVSDNVTKGHLLTLDLAKYIKQNNGVVKNINMPFNDGIKLGTSDIDLIFTIKNKTYVAEVKNYKDLTINSLNETFKPDMLTLQQYSKLKDPNCEKIFILKNKPSNDHVRILLEKYAQDYGVKIIYGNPYEVVNNLMKYVQ